MTSTEATRPGPGNPAESGGSTHPPRLTTERGDPRPDRHLHLVVGLLTFAGGCGDVVALMVLGGAFTNVITGNLILVGRAVGTRSLSPALHAAMAVIGYVAGVAIGTLPTRISRSAPRRPPRRGASERPGSSRPNVVSLSPSTRFGSAATPIRRHPRPKRC
jgi:hypothetical protein